MFNSYNAIEYCFKSNTVKQFKKIIMKIKVYLNKN